MSAWTAKYHGECEACDEPIRPGDLCVYGEASGTQHADCAEVASRTRPVEVCTTCWLTKPCDCEDDQ